jgi:hypothetical protein
MTSAFMLSNEPTGGSSVPDPKLGHHNRVGWAGLRVEEPALWFSGDLEHAMDDYGACR